MVNISDIADTFGIYTYKDPVIYYAVDNHDNWKHREVAARKGFLMKAYISRMDEEIMSEDPIIVPDIFKRTDINTLEEPSTELDADNLSLTPPVEANYQAYSTIHDDWVREKWNRLFAKIMDKARTHSFCVVQLYNKPPWWRIFHFRDIIEMYYDELDQPIGCKVQWSRCLPLQQNYNEHEETLTFVDSYDDEGNKLNTTKALFIPFKIGEGNDLGEYEMEDIWSLWVYINYQLLDVVNNSAKTSGFWHFVYGMSMDSTKSQQLANAIDYISSTKGIGAKKDVLEEIRSIFPAKPEFTLDAIDRTLRFFAGACRLPLSYFNAESEVGGIIANSGYGDDIKINRRKRAIFGQFKQYFMTLIQMRWGIQIEDIFPNIPEFEEEHYGEEVIEIGQDRDQEANKNENKEVVAEKKNA